MQTSQINEIAQTIGRSIDIPPIPVVTQKALQMMNNPDVTLQDLVKVISMDQSLSAQILKISNSVFYGATQEIKTLPIAMSRIGLKNLKNVIIGSSSRSLFKNFGKNEQMLWDHAMGVSIACRIISRNLSFIDEEEAFLAGLLHDAGKAIINNNEPEKYGEVLVKVDEGKEFYKAEMEIFTFNHAQVGALFIKQWKLPAYLENVILWHHQPFIDREMGSTILRMTSLVQLADLIALHLGIGYQSGPREIDFMLYPCVETLSILPDAVHRVCEETLEILDADKQLFN